MKQIITKCIGYLVISVAVIQLQITPVQAQTIFNDDFSSDMSQWQVVQGEASIWKVTNGLMTGTLTPHFSQAVVTPINEIWDDNWITYEFSFDMLPVQGADTNIIFGYEDPSNWYELHFYPGGSEVVKVSNGGVVWQQDSPHVLNNGSWHHFQISLSTKTITISQNGTVLFDLTDPAFAGGFHRPGLKVSTGASAPTEVYFDNIAVKVADSVISLPVPLFMQSNSLWANIEYDSANNWAEADNSISAWGCALSSAVMILQYHGFTELPNGTYLTPESLNQWLFEQPDGYIGEGLVNWLAISRLTYQLSQNSDLYTLEYQQHFPSLEQIRHQLQSNNPVILQIPGHFLVGNGIDSNDDITINDPAYSYTKFSQHNKELVSFRTFIPSHTDLSHLLFVYEAELNLSLTYKTDPINPITSENFLTLPTNQIVTTRKIIQTELAQPPLGNYTLTLSQAETKPISLELYAYDQQGNPTITTIALTVGPYPIELKVKLNEQYQLTYQQIYNFTKLQQDLEQMISSNDLYYWRTFFILEENISYAVNATNTTDQLRYITLIRELINKYQIDFSPTALKYLIESLSILETSLQQSAV